MPPSPSFQGHSGPSALGSTVSTGASGGTPVPLCGSGVFSILCLGLGMAGEPLTLACAPHPQMASATDSRYGQKESSDQNFDYMFKILIIGNSSVGKTSFLFRYADDSFTPAFVSTVGIDFKVKTIYRNDKRIKLQIWVGLVGGIPASSLSLTRKVASAFPISFIHSHNWAFTMCLLCTKGTEEKALAPLL